MLNFDKCPQISCVSTFLLFIVLVFTNTLSASPHSTENLPVQVTNPSACNLGMTINDESCPNNNILEVDIDVISAPGMALGTDVFLKELRVIFAHDWTADLDFYLVAPNGTRVEVSTDNGSSGDNYGILNGACDSVTTFISSIYDDGCTTPNIKGSAAPFLGTYLPEGDFNDFNDGQNPNGTWQLEACDDGAFNIGKLEFIELVFEASGCIAPSNVMADNVTANTINLTWQSNVSNPINTVFEYGPIGFTLGQGMTTTANSIQNLTLNTTYEFYIREECSTGIFSTNSCPIQVTTLCTPPMATLSEDFNTQNVCNTLSNCNLDCDITGLWANVSDDDMNWLVRENSTPTGFTGPSDDADGGGRYIYLETSGFACQNGDSAVLLSNLIAVNTNPNACEMSFNYHMNGQHINSLKLDITSDCGDTWTPLFEAQGSKGDQWFREYLDLDAYDNMDVQLRFIGKKGSGFRGDIAIDNLKLFGPQLSTNQVNTFYFDGDNDGFGDDGNIVTTCNPNGPTGYILQGGDCNDNDEFINPNAAEIPCNFTDDNCNGFGDENEVEYPNVVPDEICEGELATMQAIVNNPDAEILWFEDEFDFFQIHEGEFFSPADVPNVQVNNVTVLTYWVTTFVPPFCFNSDKTPVTITIYPNPALVAQPIPDVCEGTNIALLDYVDDEKSTAGTWFCFDENDAPIQNCELDVLQNETIKIQKISQDGCRDSIFISINVLASPTTQITGNPTICTGDFQFLNGSDIGNGVAPLSYNWSTGSTATTQQIFSNGIMPDVTDIYSLTITGNNGCSHTSSLNVTTIQSIDNVSITKHDVTVCNGSDGSLDIEITGGTPPFTINWNGGQMMTNDTIFSIENLTQGAYSLDIADSSNSDCEVNTPLEIINGPGAVVSTPDITSVSCESEADGSISIEVSGTNPTIIWSNGLTNDTIFDLVTGYYSVTVFDGNCTTEVDSIFIPTPFELMAFSTLSNINCTEETDGTIEIGVAGGTMPYTYTWEDNSTLSTRNNLAAGFYSVTITDANLCETILNNIKISEPEQLIFIENINQPSCFNSFNGSISLTAAGGILPYQIAWSNGAQSFNNNFLQDGNYIFTITDANNCTIIDSSQVIEPQEIAIDDFQNNATCNGLEDGSISLVINGATTPYSIEWSHGPTGNQVNNLAQGYYFALITDANFCSYITDSIYIDAPELLSFDPQITPSHCDGVDDGAIKIIINDGQDYDFSWTFDPMETDSCLTSLTAGDYLLTITDPNMCKVDAVITVPTSNRIFVNSQALSSSCVGSQSGAVMLNISGENPLFFVEWSNGASMMANEQTGITNLSPGAYFATITDNLGCLKQTDSLIISENPAIEITPQNLTNNYCFAGEIGSIEISIEGGSGIYNTAWSNGEMQTSTNENLPAGTYQLTVTDDNGCVEVSNDFEITQPDSFQINDNLIDANECVSDLVDSLCVIVSGATAPYEYLWSNGNTSTCIIDQPTGEYSFTVTDANACEGVLEGIKIPDPVEDLQLNFPDDSLFLDCPDSEGRFVIDINGGSSPFQFIWSHGTMDTVSIDSLVIEDLDSGICNVTVTDDRGCVTVSDSIYIFRPDSIDILITEIEEVGCKGGRNGEIHLQVTGGTPTYNFEWYNELGVLWGTEQNLIDTVAADFYTVEIRDDNECFSTFTNIEVIEPDSVLNIFPLLSRDTICFGEDNGFIDITPSGGYPPYTFEWSNPMTPQNVMTTQDIFNLSAGSYGLTMTDAGDCEFQLQPYFITESILPISLETSTITDVDCFRNENGAIDVSFSGGWQPLKYEWIASGNLDNPNTPNQTGLSEGTYYLFVTDAFDCFFDDLVFEVNEPEALTATPDFSNPNGVDMQSDIELISTGGTAPYEYLWEDGNTDSLREAMEYGTYFVTITDDNDCEEIIDFLLDGTTGIDDIEEINALTLFPNPTSGELYLEVDLSKPVNLSVNVFDMFGKRVISLQNQQQNSETIPLELSHLPSGTYFVHLYVNQKFIPTKKLILMD
jgi:hypothetical protein